MKDKGKKRGRVMVNSSGSWSEECRFKSCPRNYRTIALRTELQQLLQSFFLFWISIRLAGLAWKKGEPLNSYRRGGPSTPNGSARFVSKQAIVRDAGKQALEEGGFTIPEAQYQTFEIEIEVETNRNPH